MARKKIDLTGQRFGQLRVIKEAGPTQNSKGYRLIRWLCKCDCGNEVKVITGSLTSGSTLSCGCLKRENGKKILSKNSPYRCETLRERTDLRQLYKDKQKNNTSGTPGVTFRKKEQKWYARINFKGKEIRLGYFENKQDAINARKEAEKKYFDPIIEKYNK